MHKASKSSQCPMCHKFIAKNHSWVKSLPKPITPRAAYNKSDGYWYSIDTGEAYNFGGMKPVMYPRWFVHDYCFLDALRVINQSSPPNRSAS